MLQIQPIHSDCFNYEVLAEKRGLFFEALELSFDNVSDEKYNWYRDSRYLKSFHGAFIDVNPGSGDSIIREYSKKKYEESCAKALDCGAENIVFHSTCFPFLRGAYIEVWADRCAEFYYYLAEKYSNLNIFIENSIDINPEPIKKIIDTVACRNIGVCLDIGHINYSRASVEEWFDTLGDRTGYLHLSDNMGIYDDHLPIGDGTVDWEKVCGFTKHLKKDIPVTLEVGNIDGIEKSLRFME
ncbi:MAG: sugar phosphate isomerase/epimerase, partial [Ruminococcus sp.]|nr:sugar phosphate isomerase/epimerase [Candidatus Copronaster equi]